MFDKNCNRFHYFILCYFSIKINVLKFIIHQILFIYLYFIKVKKYLYLYIN